MGIDIVKFVTKLVSMNTNYTNNYNHIIITYNVNNFNLYN